MMTLDRRRFLKLTSLGVLTTVAHSACARADDRGAALDHPQLLEVLGSERVRELGARYRAANPTENSPDALRAAISDGPASRFLFPSSLAGQISDEFEAGRTILVDGWVLSVTEARQCALFSLTPA